MFNTKVYMVGMLNNIPKVTEITILTIVKREKSQKNASKNIIQRNFGIIFKNHQKMGKFSVRTILVTFFQLLQYLLNKE